MTGFVKVVATALLLAFPLLAQPQDSITTAPLNSMERDALNPTRDMLEHGDNVARTACATCHGVNGVGVEPGIPNLAGQRTVYLYRVLQGYRDRTRLGDEMNHAVGFLNEDALLAVATYFASLPPARPEPLAENEAVTALGAGDPFAGLREDLGKCARCHGEDGNASASGMPNLTAQSAEYFVHSMQAYANGARDHRLMGRLAEGLDEATLERMGVFYAVQEPKKTSTVGDGNADRGRELAGPCATCHGQDGNASGADMPTLAGQDARYFLKAMAAYGSGARQHEGMFEAVETLEEADVADLAAFYAVQEPVRRAVHAPLTTSEWIERCERCHGIDGNSTDPRFPMLAGQDRKYLESALRSYIGETRNSSTMHAMAEPLSEADIERLAEFYATREPKSVVYMQLPCVDDTEK